MKWITDDRPPLPEAEIERMKLNINIQIMELEGAADEAIRWFADWKKRNSGFRCRRA